MAKWEQARIVDEQPRWMSAAAVEDDAQSTTATAEPPGDGWDEMYASIKANEAEAKKLGISVYELNLQKGAAAEQENNPKSAVRRIAETGINAATGVVVDPLLKVEEMLGSETAEIARGDRQFKQDVRNLQSSGWLESTISGVVDSVATAATSGALGGLPAMLGTIGNKSYDQSFRSARREGKSESEARKIAMANAALEVGVTGAFQLAGFGGLEQQVLNGTKWKGVKALLKQVAGEVAEEEITTLGQNLASHGDVGKPEDYFNTAVQSILAMGVVGGSQKVLNFIDNPSRSNARKLGLGETSAKEREAIAEQTRATVDPKILELQEVLGRAMPKARGKVTKGDQDGQYRINFGDLGNVELWEVDQIKGGRNPQEQEAFIQKNLNAYGFKDTPANRQLIQDADGAYYMRLPGGKSADALGIIALKRGMSREADQVLRHELVHMLIDNGVLNDSDLSVWAKTRGMEGATREQLSEALAQRGTDWGGLGRKVSDFFRAVLEMMGLSDAKVREIENKLFSGELAKPQSAGSPAQDTRITGADPQSQAEYDAMYAQQEPTVAQATPVAEQSTAQPEAAPEAATEPPVTPPEVPKNRGSVDDTSGQIGIKHASTEVQREQHGFPAYERGEPLTDQQTLEQAVAEGVPDRALQIAEELIATPRPMTKVETAGFLHKITQLEGQAGDVSQAIEKLGDKAEPSHAALLKQIEGDLLTLYNATDPSGTAAGQALQARKMLLNPDFTPVRAKLEAKAVKGSDLTPQEKTKIESKVNRRDRAKKALDKLDQQEKKKQHREVQRLKSAVSNIRQRLGLDPQKLGNVDVPGLNDSERSKVAELNTKLREAEAALERMATLPVLDRVHNRPSEKIISDLDGKLAEVRSIIAKKNLKPPTDAEIEQRRITGLEKQLTKIEEQLASPDNVQQFNYDVASQRRTELKEQIAEARKKLREKQPPSSRRVEVLKIKALERAIGKAQDDLAKVKAGISTAKEKPADVPSERRTQLEFQLKKSREEVRRAIDSLRPKSYWDWIKEGNSVIMGLKGSIDFSALLRQGKLVVRHPIILAKAATDMVRAARSDYAFHKQYRGLMQRDNATDYERTNLAIQDLDSPLNEREDFIASELLSKVPGIRGSQRAYIALLNRMRADLYDAMKAGNGGDASLTWADKNALAHMANVMTGRGDWKRLDPHMRTVAVGLWAPRLLLGRTQFAVGQPIWQATPNTRMTIAKEHAASLVGLGAYYSGMALAIAAAMQFGEEEDPDWSLHLDPRDADFGKFRIGSTRIDPMGGFAQILRFTGQALSGQEIKDGKKKDLTAWDRKEKAVRFLEQKAAPGPRFLANLYLGENYEGDPIGVTSLAGIKNMATDALAPISIQNLFEEDIKIQLKEMGITGTAAVNLLSLLGEGVNTYEAKDARRPSRPTRALSSFAPR